MKIITFTTDLGNKDYFAGVLKGLILQNTQSATFVDITHQVEHFNLQQGAHVLRSSFRSFPEKTIHTVVVGMENVKKHRCIFFEHNGYYFVGPDNGIFPLALKNLPRDIYTLEQSNGLSADVAHVVSELSNGNDPRNIGIVTGNIHALHAVSPPVNDDMIKTSVVYIDVYGNVICGISKSEFEASKRQRKFAVEFGKRDIIETISQSYSDVPPGEKLCRFNESGFLEIAIHKGNAHELLGLKVNDTVLIEFL